MPQQSLERTNLFHLHPLQTLGLLPSCFYLSTNTMTLKLEVYGYVPSPIIFKSLLS